MSSDKQMDRGGYTLKLHSGSDGIPGNWEINLQLKLSFLVVLLSPFFIKVALKHNTWFKIFFLYIFNATQAIPVTRGKSCHCMFLQTIDASLKDPLFVSGSLWTLVSF